MLALRCHGKRTSSGEFGEPREGGGIDVDGVRAFGLGQRQHRTVGSLHPASAERDPSSFDVDVVPTQTEQLRPPRPSDCGGEQEHMQERVAVSDEVEQRAQLGRRWRAHLSAGAATIRWARCAGLSQIHPQRIA